MSSLETFTQPFHNWTWFGEGFQVGLQLAVVWAKEAFRLCLTSIPALLVQRKLRWFGYAARRPEGEPTKDLLLPAPPRTWRRRTCQSKNRNFLRALSCYVVGAHVSLIFATYIIPFQLANRRNPRWRPLRSKPNRLRWSTIGSPRSASNSRFVSLSFIDSLSPWSPCPIKVDHAPLLPVSYAVRSVIHLT